VERSTEANAEPRKARPLLPITVKNSPLFFAVWAVGVTPKRKKLLTKGKGRKNIAEK